MRAMMKTNLYTVAPNITGAVMFLILGFISDYTRWRFPFVALGLSSPACSSSTPQSTSRSRCKGLLCLLRHDMGQVRDSTPSVLLNMFSNKDAPDYIPALATTAAFGGMGDVLLTLGLGASMIFDNRRRDRK
jgi:hypothetical protein